MPLQKWNVEKHPRLAKEKIRYKIRYSRMPASWGSDDKVLNNCMLSLYIVLILRLLLDIIPSLLCHLPTTVAVREYLQKL
jgi:hypothetical protein